MNSTRFLLMGLVLAASAALGLSHDAEVLNRIDSQITASGAQFSIQFNIPVQYLNHTPRNEGKTFIIKVRPVGVKPPEVIGRSVTPPGNFPKPERLSWTATKELPLTEIRYEGEETSGAQIEVVFEREVKYSVAQGKDFRSIVVTLVGTQSQSESTDQDQPTKGSGAKYALNLLTSDQPIDMSKHSTATKGSALLLYQAKTQENGDTKYHLRLGFLSNARQVTLALAQYKPRYAESRVVLVSEQEFASTAKDTTSSAPDSISMKGSPEELMERAKRLTIDTRYREAITIYSHILLKYPNTSYAKDALEYQGLARQRNHQVAHAKSDYQLYLKLYKSTPGASRVKQRLDALLSASKDATGEIDQTKKGKAAYWHTSGDIYATYRVDKTKSTTATATTETETKSAVASFNAIAQHRSETGDLRVRFSGSYVDNFVASASSKSNELITSYFYVDYRSKVNNWAARAGRQTQNTGGVLGRFDGLSLDYNFSPKWKLNVVSGSPVNISDSNAITFDRYFYGANMDYVASKYMTYNVFAIQQTVDGITDRSSLGGEIRYLHPKHAIFALVDYDVSYNELNALVLSNNWRFKNDATLNLVYDHRKSPILTTSNALSGQSVTAIEELLKSLTEEQIRQLARDRTAEYTAYSVSGTYPLANNLLLYGDVVLSNLEGTAASTVGVPVAATPATGNEWYYSAQLIRNNLFATSDIATMGLRFADAATYDKVTYTLQYRYPLTKTIRLVPQFDIESQNMKTDSTEIETARAKLRVEYRPWKRARFELEGGTALSKYSNTAIPREDTNDFFSISLIADY